MKMSVLPSGAQETQRAQALARQLNLPCVTTVNQSCQLYLVVTPERLELHCYQNQKPLKLAVDFLKGPLAYRRLHGGGMRQLLARAVGVKGGVKPTVIDATAGLGRDAFILASLGCRVTMIERSGVIAALVADGLQRLNAAGVDTALDLIVANAIDYLPKMSAPDVIYLDPMFPARTKSALVKKEMRIISHVVGKDLDATHLLEIALKTAKKRVVVKRPRLAKALGDIPPQLLSRR